MYLLPVSAKNSILYQPCWCYFNLELITLKRYFSSARFQHRQYLFCCCQSATTHKFITLIMFDICSSTGCITLALIIFGVWVFSCVRRSSSMKEEAKKRFLEYHDLPNPFLTTFMGKRPEVLEMEYAKNYGSTYGSHVFSKFTVMCSEPELIQKVLNTEFTNFTDRRVGSVDPFEFKGLVPVCILTKFLCLKQKIFSNVRIFSKLLFIVNGEDWKRIRSIVTPTFTSGKLLRMKPCLDDTISKLVKNLHTMIKTK